MKIFIGADYRGFELKKDIIDFLVKSNYEVSDMGAYEAREGDDYNDPAIAVAKLVRKDLYSFGILICDSAHGMTIQANRFRGIRAAHCNNEESARLAREHDDANVLCLSAHFLNADETKGIVKAFLETNFSSLERRVRRINRLDGRENYD